MLELPMQHTHRVYMHPYIHAHTHTHAHARCYDEPGSVLSAELQQWTGRVLAFRGVHVLVQKGR